MDGASDPLLSCVPVKGTYDALRNTDGKDAASLYPSALVSSRTTSTGMTNPVSNKVPQRRNTKAEAKEWQHQKEQRKEHNVQGQRQPEGSKEKEPTGWDKGLSHSGDGTQGGAGTQ